MGEEVRELEESEKRGSKQENSGKSTALFFPQNLALLSQNSEH
jgi:hypothetical protein